jgi:hypothetical protein
MVKMKTSLWVLAVSNLLASMEFAEARGTSGGSGTAASIPGSVVGDHEQRPGLFEILARMGPQKLDREPAKRTALPVDGGASLKAVTK